MKPAKTARARSNRNAKPLHVYYFDDKGADGNKDMKDILGGKGANLAEMCALGMPVPPGFTISTEVCTFYSHTGGTFPPTLRGEMIRAVERMEQALGREFGNPDNPLLVSVRSGARVSMPGMMDTVLNLGLNDETVEGLAKRSGNERFAWDSYRRFLQMYSDVVLDIRADPGEQASPFSLEIQRKKKARGVDSVIELEVEDLKDLVARFKKIVKRRTGEDFPESPADQLWGAIGAVFGSWNNDRAIAYREMNRIPGDWGTAVNVMAMVFGNMGQDSGTGVAFTRDPATGERRFYGEFLMNAQGEDVVAGIRTPDQIEKLEKLSPKAYKQLLRIQKKLERHYRDMQDLEFTIENGRLFMLQCRSGKRTGFASVRIAVDMVGERLISQTEALMRVDPEALNQLLQPVFDPKQLSAAKKEGRLLTKGLNAGPGAASGKVCFTAADAVAMKAKGHEVLLVREETSPEDIRGMHASSGILTARGGMTSHAALVARQMGKVCVAGAGECEIDCKKGRMVVNGTVVKAGDELSLNGTTGEVYSGSISTRQSEVLDYLFGKGRKKKASAVVEAYEKLMTWADKHRTLGVRTNADQPDQCLTAIAFGAEGVGLTRTEHMFFEGSKIDAVREMILAADTAGRERALKKLLPLQRKDFEGIFKAMQGRPVTVRTLDPPLHEFLPHEPAQIKALAKELGVTVKVLQTKMNSLQEFNPMLGHRGCRLGISFPEITRTQARALFEAACNVAKRTKVMPRPEIMIPLVSTARELELQADIVHEVAAEVFTRKKISVPYLVGTMIELPRACLTAGEIASTAEFFSFGTNDLTQTTYGISRDDGGHFIPEYIEKDIFQADPFASLDAPGVGRLMEIACADGRRARRGIKLGICGEHGGDPRSIQVCQDLGLDYVSCSPYRVPIARLAAAQAAISKN
ncbi:MAG: pyruvate, phosphate dikinase [Planctomycetota bacterium]|nr:pyruvate, phosphate dikinase [Planctomycetota bacterium]